MTCGRQKGKDSPSSQIPYAGYSNYNLDATMKYFWKYNLCPKSYDLKIWEYPDGLDMSHELFESSFLPGGSREFKRWLP